MKTIVLEGAEEMDDHHKYAHAIDIACCDMMETLTATLAFKGRQYAAETHAVERALAALHAKAEAEHKAYEACRH